MKPDFAPVEKSNLADDLGYRIAEMIGGGIYGPGDRLPATTEMARSFGVGHPSVREALKQLEVVGIIEIKHGSGIYVRKGKDVQHESILDAIRKKDANQARDRMMTHLSGVRRAIVQWDPERTPLA